MKKSKVILLNIIGIIILALLVFGFALLTNVEPGEGKEEVSMNAQEERAAEKMEPVLNVIFDETRSFFVTLEEEFARIDIELQRGPEAQDDSLLSGFILQLLREDIVTEGEVTLNYTEAQGENEKEKF